MAISTTDSTLSRTKKEVHSSGGVSTRVIEQAGLICKPDTEYLETCFAKDLQFVKYFLTKFNKELVCLKA